MNRQIVEYLKTNKDNYTKESLIEQLRSAGHNDMDITGAINAVYGDTDILVPLPQEAIVQSDVKYAGFWIRVVAVLVDGFVVGVSTMLFLFLITLTARGSFMVTVTAHLFIWCGMSVVYFIAMTNKYQATLGKMAVGIKVCDANTLQKASSKNIILREILSKVISHIPGVNLLIVIIAFTQKKQGMHDFAANTVVIYKNS